MSKKPIVVTGATGKQGGAVVDHLLERGHAVRAITRDIESPKAAALAKRGVTLVKADLDDTPALVKALQGAASFFAMTTPFSGGIEAETRQGISAADAAKEANVPLVFTSVGNADRQTGIPHFESKYEVEKHIAAIGAKATILAPVYFMENLYFGKDQLAKGVYGVALPPQRKLAQIAVEDIGAVASRVLESPERFAGQRFDLAGDELTGEESVAILARVLGRPFTYFHVPLAMIETAMGDDGVKMYTWFDRVGYTADRPALAKTFPDVAFQTFESWLKKQDLK